jgi:hypothetical protein
MNFNIEASSYLVCETCSYLAQGATTSVGTRKLKPILV